MNKKALSPVIATTLLISLVLVLAVIIFLWARAFLPEALTKSERPIEEACKDVVFIAEYSGNSLIVQNNGNVPIYGLEIGIRRGFGSLEYLEGDYTGTIVAGNSRSFDLSGAVPTPEAGDDLVIIPVLLGKTNDGKMKAFICSDELGQTIKI
ncbi:MAG: archaellin/type IV pilin N-terminal domain-containing protein [Candidatus Pacearchaeota archaeon]